MVATKAIRKKWFSFILIILVIGILTCILLNIPFSKINLLSDCAFITSNELSEIEKEGFFGPFVCARIKEDSVVNTIKQNENEIYEPEIEFRLFNLIPIKFQKIKMIRSNKVLASGAAIGLVLKTDGVLIVGSSFVTTVDGERDVLDENILKIGDVIKQIENETVENVSSISRIINEEKNQDRELEIKLIRKNKELTARVKPCYDVKSQDYKLGIWVRDDASGIGTLTYIGDNNRFGALGHPICDSDTKSKISLKEGKVYNCSILGVNKGTSGNPGEIKGLFMQGKNEQGVVEKNNDYGVFGNINDGSVLFSNTQEYEIGGRLSVKPGKAQIRCCIDGTHVETFDIEIIKTNFQNYSNDKSMVIRVIDEDLLNRTGGIVQGMSGSPIIQDNKIVGAVTHVFVSDPSKGFGVYIDWMLNQ